MGSWTIEQLGHYDFDGDDALSEEEIGRFLLDLGEVMRRAGNWFYVHGLHPAFVACDKDKSGAIPLDEGVNCFKGAFKKLIEHLP